MRGRKGVPFPQGQVAGGSSFTISYAGGDFDYDVGDVAAISVNENGGVAPVTYALQSGALPEDVTVDANTGEISGTVGAFA